MKEEAFTNEQLDLFHAPGRGSIEERFKKFHKENPHIYEKIVELALWLKGRGLQKCGIALIFERMRWNHAINTKADDFKLCNDYRAMYARKVMEEDLRLGEFFTVRERRSLRVTLRGSILI